MMGVQSVSQNKLFHFGINIDKRIRANHPLRKVNELIDFWRLRGRRWRLRGRRGG